MSVCNVFVLAILTTNCLIKWMLPAQRPLITLSSGSALVCSNHPPILCYHTIRSRPLHSVWIDIRFLVLATVLTTEVAAIRCAACFSEDQALCGYVPGGAMTVCYACTCLRVQKPSNDLRIASSLSGFGHTPSNKRSL